MRPYLTVRGRGEAEQTIERSRFIGYVCPASTPEECAAFFDEIRRMHRDATHNVPAYVLGDTCSLVWAGDDGEPRGTSGAPIAHMLAAEGISDIAVVVTRYFGGVKLGTGGLVRAYTGTARLAIDAAGLCSVRERLAISFEADYAGYHRIEAAFRAQGGELATGQAKIRTEKSAAAFRAQGGDSGAGGAVAGEPIVLDGPVFAERVRASLLLEPAQREEALERLAAACPSARVLSEEIGTVRA